MCIRDSFMVRPNQGLLKPDSSERIKFSLNYTQSMHTTILKSRFLIQSIQANDVTPDKLTEFFKVYTGEREKDLTSVKLSLKLAEKGAEQTSTLKVPESMIEEKKSEFASPDPSMISSHFQDAQARPPSFAIESNPIRKLLEEAQNNLAELQKKVTSLEEEKSRLLAERERIRNMKTGAGPPTAVVVPMPKSKVKMIHLIIVPIVFYILGSFLASK
eukprot:TRINITY_DN4136_c0_g3_i1.p1 TRINITY_DN4136_c0_g3~~TRINITY_DN4136_c0_g3_i1.p1  ORF type:complete len:216 (+),score=67.03 TRINITY_DN4136_c0_g3_i1:65-712(+)